MKLIKLDEYRNRGVVNALEELLAMARSGQIKAVSVVAKFTHDDHRAYLAGDYKHHPAEALTATFMMERNIEKRMNRSSGFKEST